jgi:hypothetical protein
MIANAPSPSKLDDGDGNNDDDDDGGSDGDDWQVKGFGCANKKSQQTKPKDEAGLRGCEVARLRSCEVAVLRGCGVAGMCVLCVWLCFGWCLVAVALCGGNFTVAPEHTRIQRNRSFLGAFILLWWRKRK